MFDRYGPDVLAHPPEPTPAPEVTVERGLVVECASTGFCGAVMGVEKTGGGWAAVLEDRHGRRRLFPLDPAAFLLEGRPVTLVRPAAGPRAQRISASGSRVVEDLRAQVARGSRIWVEGRHDAELVERVWGHDLRVEGVVVEPLHGADDLPDRLDEFAPGPGRRVGVLLDHLVPGSKETRIAAQVTARFGGYVEVAGHPFVDIWAAVKPTSVGITAWPEIPPGQPWKQGVIAALGWEGVEADAWRRILAAVDSYTDLEPALLGRVEQLIDFVTSPESTTP
ncbi:MAG: DUF3097 domain-containing protein [Actinobacteria bacterium]|nr:DUF3097 domain-containing protein [Actinomycetota bacterium]